MDNYYDEDDPGEDKYLDKDEEEKIPLAIKKKQEVKKDLGICIYFQKG